MQQNRNRLTDIESKLVDTSEERDEGGHGFKRYKLLCIR